MTLAGMMTGCRHKPTGTVSAAVTDSIPDEVRQVVLAVENSDTVWPLREAP